MLKNKQTRRFRWLLAMAALSTTGVGCNSWGHHVAKHSLFTRYSERHHEPYYQCEDCGQIIMNDSHHQCSKCIPRKPFYGFKSTCWTAWPEGWQPCPNQEATGCWLDGEPIASQSNVMPPPIATTNITPNTSPNITTSSTMENISSPNAMSKSAKKETAPDTKEEPSKQQPSPSDFPAKEKDETSQLTAPKQEEDQQQQETETEIEQALLGATRLDQVRKSQVATKPMPMPEIRREDVVDEVVDEIVDEIATIDPQEEFELAPVDKKQVPTPIEQEFTLDRPIRIEPVSAKVSSASAIMSQAVANRDIGVLECESQDGKPSTMKEYKEFLELSRASATHFMVVREAKKATIAARENAKRNPPKPVEEPAQIDTPLTLPTQLPAQHPVAPAKKVSLLDRLHPKK